MARQGLTAQKHNDLMCTVSHERTGTGMTIKLLLTDGQWFAVFAGDTGNMPAGVPLVLPFSAGAPADMVRADMVRRFPQANVEVL